jgi:hypothetical protein
LILEVGVDVGWRPAVSVAAAALQMAVVSAVLLKMSGGGDDG